MAKIEVSDNLIESLEIVEQYINAIFERKILEMVEEEERKILEGEGPETPTGLCIYPKAKQC